MGPVAPILSAVGAVASVVGTLESNRQQKKSAAAQKKSQRAQRASQNFQAMRERRIQAAQAQRLQAAQIAGGFSSGVSQGSSAVQGAVGGISAQLASNVGAAGVTQGLAEQASIFNQLGADAATSAQQAQSIAGLGTTIFNSAFSRV